MDDILLKLDIKDITILQTIDHLEDNFSNSWPHTGGIVYAAITDYLLEEAPTNCYKEEFNSISDYERCDTSIIAKLNKMYALKLVERKKPNSKSIYRWRIPPSIKEKYPTLFSK